MEFTVKKTNKNHTKQQKHMQSNKKTKHANKNTHKTKLGTLNCKGLLDTSKHAIVSVLTFCTTFNPMHIISSLKIDTIFISKSLFVESPSMLDAGIHGTMLLYAYVCFFENIFCIYFFFCGKNEK